MPAKPLNLEPIVLGRTRVKHPAAGKSGTVPGYRLQCHNCGGEFAIETGAYNRGQGLFCSTKCNGEYRRRTPKEVLMSHVTKHPDGCWIFEGSTVNHGHGQVRLHTGENWLAHRLSWTIYVGPIPDGMQVCHRCDVPVCVNPEHLFLGTQADNIQDAIDKGRFVNPVMDRAND